MINLIPDQTVPAGNTECVTPSGGSVLFPEVIHCKKDMDDLFAKHPFLIQVPMVTEIRMNPVDLAIYNQNCFKAELLFISAGANAIALPDIDLDQPAATKIPDCECGAEKCKSNIHSSWCPARV